LNGLTAGSHYVEVSGRRDTGKYQDDAACGVAASLTRSRTWTVGGLVTPLWLSIERVGDTAVMTFNAAASQSYSVFYRDSLAPVQPWVHLKDFTAASTNRLLEVTDPNAGASQTRFYQLRSP
jgi:hypothetical protein